MSLCNECLCNYFNNSKPSILCSKSLDTNFLQNQLIYTLKNIVSQQFYYWKPKSFLFVSIVFLVPSFRYSFVPEHPMSIKSDSSLTVYCELWFCWAGHEVYVYWSSILLWDSIVTVMEPKVGGYSRNFNNMIHHEDVTWHLP